MQLRGIQTSDRINIWKCERGTKLRIVTYDLNR